MLWSKEAKTWFVLVCPARPLPLRPNAVLDRLSSMAPSHRRVKPFEHELRELSPLFTNEVRLWSDGALALLLVGVEPYRSGTQMIDVTVRSLRSVRHA